ncbi:MAG: metallophosphoesterase family protein [Beijerinckiaceae bacterium]
MITTIAQISDSHLSPSKAFFQSNFDLVAEQLRRERPDMVINTGDLALDGADSEADLALAADAHKGLGLETHLLPGNHDVGDHPDVARRQPANAERLVRYRQICGADFWSLDVPGWRLLGLNALILGTDLPGEAGQQALVEKAAATLAGRRLAIFMHKPLADVAYNEALAISRFMTAGPRQTLLSAMKGAAPALVLCGHVHQYRDTMIEQARHIWAPATSFMISDPWQPGYGAKTVGYLTHRFHADGTHDHALTPVRGLVHHDLAEVSDAYGDVRSWGPGNA